MKANTQSGIKTFDKGYYDNYFFEKDRIVKYDDVDWDEDARYICKKYDFRSFLDVGCGTGNLIRAIEKRGKFAFGLENSDYAIRKGLSRNARIAKIHIGKEKFPFPDNSFDIVHCWGVLEYLKSEKEIINAMKEMNRVCKKLILFAPRLEKDNKEVNRDVLTNKRFDFKSKSFWMRLWKKSGSSKKVKLIEDYY